jgi:NADPH:quinone reductase
MRAVVCERLGDPVSPPPNAPGAALRVSADAAPPPPAGRPPPGHVRVRIAAASLNFADILQVAGKYQDRPPLPFIVGSDFSGVVVEAGDGVPRDLSQPGARVCGVAANKAFAEEAVVPAAGVWRLPDGFKDLQAAAGIPVAFGTADLALRHRAGLKAGQTLLVLGASGGVGAAAVQIGRLLGARVVAVARGADKARFLRDVLGAHAVVDTAALKGGGGGGGGGEKHKEGGETDERALSAAFRAALAEAVASAGADGGDGGDRAEGRKRRPPTADVVFDNVGGAQFNAALRCASWGGQLLAVGFASGAIPRVPANLLLVKNATLHGVFWGAHLSNPAAGPGAAAALRESVGRVLGWAAEGRLAVHASARLPLEKVGEAALLMAGRRVTGKVLLVVSEEVGGGKGGGGGGEAAGTAGGGDALVGGPPPYPRSRL